MDTYADATRFQRFNGEDSIGLTVTKQPDANSIKVADDVKATIDRVGRTMPQGITFKVANDTTRYTRDALHDVQFDLTLAVFITATVLLLFLHSWRNTLIVLLAIPISLISTFMVMYFLGFSLNLMSLMALALLIGILVDDSIVVLENIHRHLALGETPWTAALKGRSEIGLAAIAITLLDVVVYVPVAFMSGNIGTLFRQFGLTIAAATLFSLFVSFTLTPLLASRWLKAHGEGGGDEAKRGRGDRGLDRRRRRDRDRAALLHRPPGGADACPSPAGSRPPGPGSPPPSPAPPRRPGHPRPRRPAGRSCPSPAWPPWAWAWPWPPWAGGSWGPRYAW